MLKELVEKNMHTNNTYSRRNAAFFVSACFPKHQREKKKKKNRKYILIYHGCDSPSYLFWLETLIGNHLFILFLLLPLFFILNSFTFVWSTEEKKIVNTIFKQFVIICIFYIHFVSPALLLLDVLQLFWLKSCFLFVCDFETLGS